MDARLTTYELALLKQLAAAGNLGRTVIARRSVKGMRRLMLEGYVSEQALGGDSVLYRITLAGRHERILLPSEAVWGSRGPPGCPPIFLAFL
jgi:hypothetical protein